MKNAIANIGTRAYNLYAKPLPMLVKRSVLRAILGHFISTTATLIIAGILKLINERKNCNSVG